MVPIYSSNFHQSKIFAAHESSFICNALQHDLLLQRIHRTAESFGNVAASPAHPPQTVPIAAVVGAWAPECKIPSLETRKSRSASVIDDF